MQQQIQELGKLVQSSQKILLINHIRMDGDAWGSLGGLSLVLQKIGKQVRAINDSTVPDSLNFLGYSDIIEPNLDVAQFDPDIIISLDAAGIDRLGESYTKWESIFQEKHLVVIDHHISNPGFGNTNIVIPEASSVCEIITDIITELGLEKYVTPQAATFLYTGLQTDTNMYATSNTTANTLRAGAKLIEWGANFRLPIEKCFRQKTPEQISAWKLAYKKTEISLSGNISYSVITPEDATNAQIPLEKLSEYLKGFINETLINIEGIKVAFLLYPLVNGEIKGSMRSIDGYDVNTICQKFGGGGHIQAAGFQSTFEIEALTQQILKEIE